MKVRQTEALKRLASKEEAMTKKQLWAAMIYIVAIALPTAALGVRYGFDTNVNLTNSPEALHQLLAMATGIVCGVVISLIGSRLLGSESENLLGFTSRVLRQLNQQSRLLQSLPGRRVKKNDPDPVAQEVEDAKSAERRRGA